MTNEMILFLDIETVPEFENYEDLPLLGQEAFAKKFTPAVERGDYPTLVEAYAKNASFLAEFSKIVCISVGRIFQHKEPEEGASLPGKHRLKVGSLIGDEDTILRKLIKMLSPDMSPPPDFLCAHNGKNFDFPFIARRMLIRGFAVPKILDVRFKKPWETSLLDTLTMWQMGNFKDYISLITLAYVFGLKSPKDQMSGADVAPAFRRGEILKIASYCVGDLITLVNVFMCMEALPIFETNIDISEPTGAK